MVEIRCPGDKKHYKRKGDLVVADDKCNSLIGFINTSANGSEFARKCNECKSVVRVNVRDEVAYISLLGKTKKIKTEIGRVVVENV